MRGRHGPFAYTGGQRRSKQGRRGESTFGFAGGPNFGIGQIFALAQIQLELPGVVDVDHFVGEDFFHLAEGGWCSGRMAESVTADDNIEGFGSVDKGAGVAFGSRVGTDLTRDIHPFCKVACDILGR